MNVGKQAKRLRSFIVPGTISAVLKRNSRAAVDGIIAQLVLTNRSPCEEWCENVCEMNQLFEMNFNCFVLSMEIVFFHCHLSNSIPPKGEKRFNVTKGYRCHPFCTITLRQFQRSLVNAVIDLQGTENEMRQKKSARRQWLCNVYQRRKVGNALRGNEKIFSFLY